MRFLSRPTVRRVPTLLAAMIVLAPGWAGAAPPDTPSQPPQDVAQMSVAQRQQPPGRVDPALRDLAVGKAGAFVLSSADGARQCPLVLQADPAPHGFLLDLDRPACAAAIGFVAEVTAWVPDESGALHFVNGQGRTVAEFTESTAGSYEALRDGDGVYFLSDPGASQTSEVTPAEVEGAWNLVGSGGKVVCRWTFAAEKAPQQGGAVSLAEGCDTQVTQLGPISWRLEGGNILVSVRKGAAIRFARQEDGAWARVPERGRPLLLSRP